MTLHTKILDAARDEVILKHQQQYREKYDTWEKWLSGYIPSDELKLDYEIEAALLAMEKQTAFYREISHQGYVCLFRSQLWTKPKTDETKTELELYNIWRGRNMSDLKKEVLGLLARGHKTFEKGYLPILGEMKREGLIDVELYKDGTAVVKLVQPTTQQ